MKKIYNEKEQTKFHVSVVESKEKKKEMVQIYMITPCLF